MAAPEAEPQLNDALQLTPFNSQEKINQSCFCRSPASRIRTQLGELICQCSPAVDLTGSYGARRRCRNSRDFNKPLNLTPFKGNELSK